MRTVILASLVLSVAACSEDRRSGGGTPAGNFCEAYASMCPVEPELEECNMQCADGTDPTADDSCWFKACGAMTGKCDNEEPGDPSILLCAIDNGWRDAAGECEFLAEDCEYCPTPEETDDCMEVADASDDRACVMARLRFPDCS